MLITRPRTVQQAQSQADGINESSRSQTSSSSHRAMLYESPQGCPEQQPTYASGIISNLSNRGPEIVHVSHWNINHRWWRQYDSIVRVAPERAASAMPE